MGGSGVRVIIHRGAHEIGGTCIELRADNTSILLDLGLPLNPRSTPTDVASLRPAAVLVSHPHMDHFGLVDGLSGSVPVYMSELAQELINSTRLFLGKEALRSNIRHFDSWVPFEVGPFRIHPYLVDHSSPEAHAFLIEVRGKRLFYSGDFRSHGRKGKLFERMIEKPPRPIDLLFLEGTMLGRDNGEFPDEAAVEAKIVQVLREHPVPAFLVCSSQNVDRIVSAFRAYKRTGRTLVVDAYTAWVLSRMEKVSNSVPNLDWDGVRVYVSHRHYTRIKQTAALRPFQRKVFGPARITIEEMDAHPPRYLRLAKMSSGRTIRLYSERGPVSVIYSQWKGYLDDSAKEHFGANDMRAFMDDEAVRFVYAHTSGHATVEDLKRFAEALAPRMVVPIHTERPEDYLDLFSNVVRMPDDEGFTLEPEGVEGMDIDHALLRNHLEKTISWAQKIRGLHSLSAAHANGPTPVHFRPGANGFSMVVLRDKTPQTGKSGLRNPSPIEGDFPGLYKKYCPETIGRQTPEKKLQSFLIRDAYRNGRNMVQLNDAASKSGINSGLIFVTDEIAVQIGHKKKRLCDILALNENGAEATPVLIELKSYRHLKVLREQIHIYSEIMKQHSDLYENLFSEILEREISFSGQIEKWVVWPSRKDGKKVCRQEYVEDNIREVIYSRTDDERVFEFHAFKE